MRTTRIIAPLCAVSMAVLAGRASPARAAGAADDAAGIALFNEGKQLAGAGDWEHACPKFAEAQRLHPAAAILLNLADCFEHVNRLASAWGAWKEAEITARNANDAPREEEAARRSAALVPQLAKLAIVVPPATRVPGLEVRKDGALVGEGQFGSALPADVGSHTIEASAPGHKAWSTVVRVETNGSSASVEIPALDEAAAPEVPAVEARRSLVVEAHGGVAIAPSFGGDIAAGCTGSCSAPPGVGGMARVDAAYEFTTGAFVGVSVGYLSVSENVTGRPSSLLPVGLPADPGNVDDSLHIGGMLVGLAGGWHMAGRFPALFRLGAGAMIGSVDDDRSGSFRSADGKMYSVAAILDREPGRFFYLAPEVRIGLRFAERFEVSAGFEALLLFALTRATWDAAASVVTPDGLASWKGETMTGAAVVVLVPDLALRAAF